MNLEGPKTYSPVEQIASAFALAKAQSRAALMPYFTLGYPNLETSLAVIEAAARSGADLLELGMPFSDPLADGPTIQRSTQVALEQGMNLTRCLGAVQTLRQRGVTQPLLLMGYYNPILSYGLKAFVAAAAAAGANGLIVPDLPLEEAAELESELQAARMALVYMLAPTSTPARIAAAAQHASGFLYLVSLTGVTGARTGISAGLADFVGRVRQATDVPVAVGFGIATPEQAQTVGKLADGVIVGSALINTVDQNPANPAEAAGAFVASLRRGLTPTPNLQNTYTPLASNAPLAVADPRSAAGDESYQGFLGC